MARNSQLGRSEPNIRHSDGCQALQQECCRETAPADLVIEVALVLSDAYLRGADLSDADLRQFKADFFMILAMGHAEVPHLIRALREGKVNGSTYDGECACLVGTLENGGASGIPHDSSSPAEQWFVPIRKGIKPGDDNEGGFRAAKALEWALEYARLTGIELETLP